MTQLSKDKIEDRIKTIIMEITGQDKLTLQSDTSLTTKGHSDKLLNIHSLELAELLFTLEEEFKVSIPDEVADDVHTIGHLTDYIFQTYQ